MITYKQMKRVRRKKDLLGAKARSGKTVGGLFNKYKSSVFERIDHNSSL
jgi:hypothetical protein